MICLLHSRVVEGGPCLSDDLHVDTIATETVEHFHRAGVWTGQSELELHTAESKKDRFEIGTSVMSLMASLVLITMRFYLAAVGNKVRLVRV